jgi:demethylmenaquinone methyltransferase / 2-methoxy-6-polyprenyl-1,4-benzoquinol methylase
VDQGYPVTGKAADRGRSLGPPTAPHPVLTKYYASDDARRPFVTALFDGTARHYDWVGWVGSLGSGPFYRRWVLGRSGLERGMKLLDVATGTGLVARAAVRVLGAPGAVVGVDPSAGMLRQARKTLSVALVQGRAEELPFADDHFDFLSMGYALRHMADLGVAFRECRRVLRPGGRLLILEISRPRSALARRGLQVWLQTILPFIMRIATGSPQAGVLMEYYWDTIAECVPPDTILSVLRSSGFAGVDRRLRGGLLSEYVAVKPAR